MFFIYGTVISYNIKAAPFRHHCDSRKGPLILFTEVLLLQVSGYIDTAGGCMGKRMCHTAAVSDNKETFVAGFQILIDLNFHVVEFNLKSPGVAERVGVTKLSSIRAFVLRLPRIRSPKRCTITPPPSMLESLAMLSPYPLLSWNGSEKCLDTRSAKFVLLVCFAGSS